MDRKMTPRFVVRRFLTGQYAGEPESAIFLPAIFLPTIFL
jgi:hypothetical protein